MKNLSLGIVVWVQNALAQGEEGQVNVNGVGGLLLAVVCVLAIIALIIWIKPHIN
jgi:small-conductance mechanosensitive channel